MATRFYIFNFVVEGSGIFPIDMLRYDSCWPDGSEAVEDILAEYPSDRAFKTRRVRLRCIGEFKTHRVTEARWRSFGWTVVSPPERDPH